MPATLGQLIRLLSSDQDGEVVAAAPAIGRVLECTGQDWHWLAERADLSAATTDTRANGHTGPQQAEPAGNEVDHQAVAEWLLATCSGRLRPNEIDFLTSMKNWIGEPTPRQAAWQSALMRKFGYAP